MANFYKIVIIILFLTIIIYSQNPNPSASSGQRIVFENLTADDGLSSGKIRCMIQDSKGFIWIGTVNGLNKFDGYNFKIYKNDKNNPASLSNNIVLSIYEDKSGVLWLGTNKGLNKYDRNLDQFTTYNHDSVNVNSISNDVIQCIYEDRNGLLFIGTENGLNIYDRENDNFSKFKIFDKEKENIQSIFEDSKGDLWIGVHYYGVFRFNSERKLLSSFIGPIYPGPYDYKECSKEISHKRILSFYETNFGQLWIGTLIGLNKYDNENECFKRYFFNQSDYLASCITQIKEDHLGNLWIGAAEGLYRIFKKDINNQDLVFEDILKNTSNFGSKTIYSIIQDKSGVIWIGTDGGGIYTYSTKKIKLNTFRKSKDDLSGLSSNFINCIYTENMNKNIVWIGTNRGLNKFDKRTGKFKHYKHDDSKPFSLTDDNVKTICPDTSNGRPILWIGTWQGVNKFDIKSEKFYSKKKIGLHKMLQMNGIWKIVKDHSGSIWFGTILGLFRYKYREEQENINRYSMADNENRIFHSSEIFTIYEAKNKNIWIGTSNGLACFDIKSDRIQFFKNDPKLRFSLSNNEVYAICEDSEGQLWIGTSDGLNVLDRKTEKFKCYYQRDGLISNSIRGIVEDKKGQLWISTTNGLSVFNQDNKIFTNYNLYDGLQGNEFNWGATYKCPNTGDMFFGGVNGFNIFEQEDVESNRYMPPIKITDFKLYNKSVPINTKIINADSSVINSPLKKHISDCESIILSHEQNFISFEFSALDFNNPKKNNYAYKMNGVDKNWIYTDASRRYANYTHLEPGDYDFFVKGSNNDGVWNEEGTSIKIIITPPWWQTWWSRVIILMMFLGLLTWIYKIRTSVLRKNHQAQKEFSRKLIDSQEKERKRIATSLHDSHGQNLLIISNEMQQYVQKHKDSENELQNVTDTVQESINEIREISYDLHPHILERVGLSDAIDSMIAKVCKSTDIQFDLIMDDVNNLFDKKVEINIYRIIQEAVNNIFKHSKATESKIEIKKNIKYVNIEISDNGIGFDKKSIMKKNNGLGLVGMKERVNLINGKYKLKSEQGRGTKIEIKIPI